MALLSGYSSLSADEAQALGNPKLDPVTILWLLAADSTLIAPVGYFNHPVLVLYTAF
jgi:hypothetical protein